MIKTKKQYFDLCTKGLCGNIVHIWKPKDFLNCSFKKLVGIRYMDINNKGFRVVSSDHARKQACIHEKNIMISEAMPINRTLLQGEYIESSEFPFGCLYGTYDKNYLRTALQKAGFHVYGLKAKRLIEHYANENSWNDFCELLDLYPKHVFEFSIYENNVGCLPHRNMIIWEIRMY